MHTPWNEGTSFVPLDKSFTLHERMEHLKANIKDREQLDKVLNLNSHQSWGVL